MEAVPAFARSAEADPRGKVTEARLDCNVPESVKDDAAFVARASGFKTTSEWMRSILYRELYGSVEHIQSLVRGPGNTKGTNSP